MRARALGSLFVALAAVGCGLEEEGASPDQDSLGETQSKVVYGTDNRTDVYAHADATLRARACWYDRRLLRVTVHVCIV